MNNMTLREKIGQLIMMDFRNWGKDQDGKPVPFTRMNPFVGKLIHDYNIGGISFFRENTATPEQTLRLVNGLQNAARIPLIIGIDQEGGVVTRIQKGTDMPGNMLLGAIGDTALTERSAKVLADELKTQDINMNFAPTVDVNSNQRNPIIGIRSFGSDRDKVSEMSAAYVRGMKAGGIISDIKHFPGHGNTATDTHLGLAVVDYSREEWEKTDLKPFAEAIRAGAETIMAAHVIVPSVDDSKCVSKKDGSLIGTPSTLSEKIINGVLRGEMKFDGVVLTDALEMKAVSDHFGSEESVIKSILAGCDMAVMAIRIWGEEDAWKMKQLVDAIEAECARNPKLVRRIDESVGRILKLKKEFNLLDKSQFDEKFLPEKIRKAEAVVGCAMHRKLEAETASKGITLIKNEDKILPFELTGKTKFLVLDANKLRLQLMKDEIEKYAAAAGVKTIIATQLIKYDSPMTDDVKKSILGADCIIMMTYSLNEKTCTPREIAAFASANNKNLAAVSCRTPYDIAYMPECKANIAIYGAVGFDQTNYMQTPFIVNMKASLKYLMNLSGQKIEGPFGKLPVSIQDPTTGKTIYPLGHGLKYN